MPDTLSQALRDWQTFYFLVGGAAAGLVGLTFVAITVGFGSITKQDTSGLRTFVNPSLIHFIYVLVTASVLVMPAVERMQLGILLVLTGLVSVGRALSTLPFMWQQYQRHVVDMHDWGWYFLAPVASYLIYMGTGTGLLLGSVEALRVLAWACILLLVAGIRNTWDMVVWLMILKDDPSKK
jgi:hypothetical protein